MLFLYLEDIRTYAKTISPETIEAQHCSLLISYLTADYAETSEKLHPMVKVSIITFEYIWALFKPGTIAIARQSDADEEDFCFKVDYITRDIPERQTKDYKERYLIEGHCLDFDGRKFGYRDVVVEIEKFKGARNMKKLRAYPLTYCTEAATVSKIRDRGRRFTTIVQKTVYQYNDLARSPSCETLQIHGRIIVDELGYRKENSDSMARITGLGVEDGVSFTKEQLLITWPYLHAFSLQGNRWARFLVSRLRDVRWADEAWGSLIMQNSKKANLLGVLKSHSQCSADSLVDLIDGKGRGHLIVLHGSPGCGKTLTAEAVSERLKVPLYTVSSGDLGIKPAALAKNLELVFDRTHSWDAILLLDEADALVQSRDNADLVSHAMVSTLIRSLEQHQGIMFMTTNYVQAFDRAVQSRVHLYLEYPAFSIAQRRELWTLFIKRAAKGSHNIIDEDIDLWKLEELNGREVNFPKHYAKRTFD
jgi:hypothetical protein